MKLQAFHWLFALTLATLLHASYGWGGLTLIDDLGPIAEHSAEREGALTWSYMKGGRWWIEQVGWQDAARMRAEGMFGTTREFLLAEPRTAMDVLHSDSLTFGHRLLLWSHSGTPVLLLLSSLAYLRRQKPIVTTRRIR